MQQEAWRLAVMATDWASLHKERLQMTDAELANQLARTAVAQAASICYGPSLAQQMPKRLRYDCYVRSRTSSDGAFYMHTSGPNVTELLGFGVIAYTSAGPASQLTYCAVLKQTEGFNLGALSCSSLMPVEDAARLIEEVCKAEAVDGEGEVLAAFDLGECLSLWAPSLMQMC